MLSTNEYIESKLFWEGGFNVYDIMATFDVCRKTALIAIANYKKNHLNMIKYDTSIKRYVMNENYESYYISDSPNEYLSCLHAINLTSHYLNKETDAIKVIDINKLLQHKIEQGVLRLILAAIRYKKTILIEYFHEELATRAHVISPGILILVDGQYYIHAYCHYKLEFRDFLLSRIIYAEPHTTEWIPPSKNTKANQLVELKFKINKHLPPRLKAIIALAYPSNEDGFLHINCNGIEAFYIKGKVLSMFYKSTQIWIEA